MNKNIGAGLSMLLLSTLACEPVFAIGWRELSCILILAAFLLGPPLYRLIRRLEEFYKRKHK
ncbi:MAG: hypothetical protein ABI904_12300 [Chloroflexota bacterium]